MCTIDASILKATVRSWTLIATLMTVPLIPDDVHPRILHPTSITTEVTEICLHIAKAKVVDPNPSVYNLSNSVKSICVAPFHSGVETAKNEEIAVDQLVDES